MGSPNPVFGREQATESNFRKGQEDLTLLRDIDLAEYRPWFAQVEPSEGYIPGNTRLIVDYMRVGYGAIAKAEVNLIFRDCART